MKSKISFFNPSLLRKDLTRFAPAWVLYGVFLLLVFGGSVLSDNQASMATVLGDSIIFFALGNFLYAMLCAQLLFGDLFQSRMCNALHALPIRRESWFATHVLAGLLFAAIPVFAAGLIFIAVLGRFYMAALLWMAALMLQFLFFFSLAVVSAMLVGNRFAAVVIYGILNFLSAIGLWLFNYLYQPHLYGFVSDETAFLRLCPMVWMMQYDWFAALGLEYRIVVKEGWGYLGICSALAVGILAVALLLYRKRALEKAGDFIVFKPTEPVFLVLYTFSAGTALHLFSELFVGQSSAFLFLLAGLAIGYFTGLMLLNRTVRVFRGKTFARFGILIAAFGLTLILTILDPIGITRWVPKEKDVEWISMDYYSRNDQVQRAITDEAVIRQVISIHQHAVEHPEEATNGKEDIQMHFSYKLKNGQVVQRQFYFDVDTLAGMSLQSILSRPELIFGKDFASPAALARELYYVEVEYESQPGNWNTKMVNDPGKLDELAEALIADALEGNLCQHYTFTRNLDGQYIHLQGKQFDTGLGYSTSHSWSVHVTTKATHTMAWLKENID